MSDPYRLLCKAVSAVNDLWEPGLLERIKTGRPNLWSQIRSAEHDAEQGVIEGDLFRTRNGCEKLWRLWREAVRMDQESAT